MKNTFSVVVLQQSEIWCWKQNNAHVRVTTIWGAKMHAGFETILNFYRIHPEGDQGTQRVTVHSPRG